ncbi:hypothetical protein D3C76_1472040 [compost metagenome]
MVHVDGPERVVLWLAIQLGATADCLAMVRPGPAAGLSCDRWTHSQRLRLLGLPGGAGGILGRLDPDGQRQRVGQSAVLPDQPWPDGSGGAAAPPRVHGIWLDGRGSVSGLPVV